VSATKGLEEGTLLRPSEVIAAAMPGHAVVAMSGPSFASEVGRGMPTAVVVASADPDAVELVQGEFRSSYLRLYGSSDVVGVEIGGALKNVIAIAAGVVEGMSIGHNAQAGLITRGLAEIMRLATALGGRPDTLAGLAGLGDRCSDLVFLHDIGPEEARSRAQRLYLCLTLLRIAPDDQDLRTLGDEPPHRRQPDPRAATGDDCHPSFDPSCHELSFSFR